MTEQQAIASPEPVGPPPTPGLRGKMAKGAVWMLFARMCDRSLGLVSTMILARLLTPADFGLVAMATAIVAMLDLMRSFSFDVVLIQNQQASRRHYDTAWTFNLGMASVLAVALVGLARPAGRFYDQPNLESVVYALALVTFIGGFQNVGIVAFRKELEFHKEFLFMFLRKLAGFLVAVPLAFVLFNFWALVAGIVATRLADVILSYLMQGYRPRLSLAARGELFRFSKWLIANNFIIFFLHRSADLVIGKVSGARALGLFNVSVEIGQLPSQEIVAPINRATFPGYSKDAGNRENLRRGYLDVLSVISLIVVPAGIGLAASAELVVPVVLGPKWVDAVPLIQLLACYSVVHAINSNNAYVYLALGKPHWMTLTGSVHLVTLLPAVLVGTLLNGPMGAAWGYLISLTTVVPVTYGVLLRELRLRLGDLWALLWRPALASSAMLLIVTSVVQHLKVIQSSGGVLLHLLVAVLVGVLVYSLIVFGLWKISGTPTGGERFVVEWIKRSLLRTVKVT